MHLIIIRRKLLGLGLKERNGPPEALSLSACGRYLGYLVDFSTRDWFYVLALFLVRLVPGGAGLPVPVSGLVLFYLHCSLFVYPILGRLDPSMSRGF